MVHQAFHVRRKFLRQQQPRTVKAGQPVDSFALKAAASGADDSKLVFPNAHAHDGRVCAEKGMMSTHAGSWQGDVEVFDLHGHPRAKRAYAWGHLDGKHDERTRFVAVLEIPPVKSAETAVRVQIVKDIKGKQ